MIATGYPFANGINTEIVDAEDSNFNCANTKLFPIKLYAATGGLMSGQTPFICGGFGDQYGGSFTFSRNCYQVTESGSWAEDQMAKITTVRPWAGYGTVVLKNNLVLTGGHNAMNGLNLMFIEMMSPNTTAQTLSVQIPIEFSGHCQVPWDSETFLVIGGKIDSNFRRETIFINVLTNQMTNGPSLNTARYEHACGELEVNGNGYIIVSGGKNDDELRSTEVLDKNNFEQGWQIGKNLKFFLNICMLDNISLHFS